ncbi:putative pyridoxal reductase 2 [Candida viswanathii]|uniref:Putative pyridoxal reductase 2 n=1 Tax=Candida viswanathii TaxID=5486 RepID=A0A367YJD9_9ASCO|nr:putative pyridoxal reductase 2 [Candida viswanathii]
MSYKPVEIPGKFGFGTMSMTWTPAPPAFEQSIDTLKFVTSHPEFGTKLINGGEFYGPDDANLKLLQEFFEKNTPEENASLIVSIKGGVDPKTLAPDGSKESIAKSIENIASYFPKSNRPKLLFEIARVDSRVPYPETIGYISEFVKNGTIDGISLSEVGKDSIQSALKVFPISCVELELSLFSQEVITTGILEELSKRDIPLIAYSPLCRGLLTDYTVENADTFLSNIPQGDIRHHLDKFQPETFAKNLPALKELYKYAHDVKQTTLESLALSWILKVSGSKNFRGIDQVTRILPIPSGSTKKRVESNLGSLIELTDADLDAIDKIFKEHPITGLRYNKALEGTLFQ